MRKTGNRGMSGSKARYQLSCVEYIVVTELSMKLPRLACFAILFVRFDPVKFKYFLPQKLYHLYRPLLSRGLNTLKVLHCLQLQAQIYQMENSLLFLSTFYKSHLKRFSGNVFVIFLNSSEFQTFRADWIKHTEVRANGLYSL